MVKLNKVKIVVFYNKKDINIFEFNNNIYNLFHEKLVNMQPTVLGPQEVPNVPLSIWNSKNLIISYTNSNFEIQLLEENLSNLEWFFEKVDDIIQFLKTELVRVGIVYEASVDLDFHEKFKEFYKYKILDSKEFNISWLDNFDGLWDYNFWQHYQTYGNNKQYIIDINTKIGQKNFDLDKVLKEIDSKYGDEISKWN